MPRRELLTDHQRAALTEPATDAILDALLEQLRSSNA